MAKTLKKALIYILILQFAVILPNFALLQKAKAYPPVTGPETVTFDFPAPPSSADDNSSMLQIIMKYKNSSTGVEKEYKFVNKGVLIEETSGNNFTGKITATAAEKLKEKGIYAPLINFQYSENSQYSLIVGNWRNPETQEVDGFWHVCGIFSPPAGAFRGWYFATDFYAVAGVNTSANLGDLVNSKYIDEPIGYASSIPELCSNMRSTWTQILQHMAKLLGKKIPENPEYWTEVGINESTEKIITAAAFVVGLVNPVLGGPLGGGVASWAAAKLSQRFDGLSKNYRLTAAGNNEAQTIKTLVKNLISVVGAIRIKNGPEWPSTDCRAARFDENLQETNDFFANPADFIKYLQILYDTFYDAVAQGGINAEDQDTDEGVCGPMLKNLRDIFAWLFCRAGEITHYIASAIMNKAVAWLTDSIGIETVKFKEPAEDTTIGSGLSNQLDSATNSSGTDGTPSGGTDGTTATGTAKPMDISGKISFTGAGYYKYSKLKTASSVGGVWVRVKKADGASSAIQITADFSNWDDDSNSSDPFSVECRFKTTQNIPSDWSHVRIYGGSGAADVEDNILFKIDIDYPPTNNKFQEESSY